MQHVRPVLILMPALLVVACAEIPDKQTLASLRRIRADTTEVQVDDGLERAIQSYRRFLDEAPATAMTPEAMRRLADLKLEKDYGILGDDKPVELPRPSAGERVDALTATHAGRRAIGAASSAISEHDLERRATAQRSLASDDALPDSALPEGLDDDLTRA